ncbi:MAG: TonB-dependent receptor, partial [Bryobacteraceae bacterium]|nr:TonB-dependent receptor [Bryobacteraceae bacterium]
MSVRIFAASYLLLLASLACGQSGGGSVVGVVTDAQDATVAGAKVTARNIGTNVAAETVTNDQGYYEFPLLQAGRYSLSIEKAGFQSTRSDEFVLSTGTRPRLDFRLQIGSVTETVQISAAAPLINSTTNDLGVVMTTAKIEDLPLNGRNFQQLVGLQPGVLNTPPGSVGGRGGIEFNGSPSYGNNLLLDGVDMSFGENHALGTGAAGAGGNGTLINTISVEAIQEFKAIGSAFSAEYGRSTGGILNVTTKSGTNKFHGTLYHFLRNDKLDANSFFNNRANLRKAPLRLNQYGGNLGGPIRRDRMFFFFNYEGATLRQGQSIVTNVPTPLLLQRVSPTIRQHLSGSAPMTEATSNPLIGLSRRNDNKTNDENTYVSRVDYHFAKHQLGVRYNYNNQQSEVPQPRPDNRFTFPLRYHNAAIQDAWAISPSLFNELRLGFNRTSLNRNNSTLYTQPGWVEVTQGPLNSDFQSQIFFIANNYTIADNFTWVRGSHTIKTGFEIRDNRTARIQTTNPTHFYTTLDDLIADQSRQVRVTFGNPGGKLYSTSYGIFLQDEWRLNRRLQLNMGLRYEYYTPLTGGFNIATSDPFGPFLPKGSAMFDPDRNNFGPRLGLVWDPIGDQKTVIRAGGGISFSPPQPFFYYDRSFI